jgi:APA family basic amino acid/polyamine antiporter
MFWSMHSGIIAAIAVVFARYAAAVVPLSDQTIPIVAIAAILALSALNYVGVRQGVTLQTILTILKVGAIVGLAALLLWGSRGRNVAAGPMRAFELDLRGLMFATMAGLFAFGGWHMVTYAAEETRDPERTIPRALMLGTVIVTVIYVALNTIYLMVLPLDRLRTSTRIAADAVASVAGARAGAAIAALVAVSSFGALSGIVLAGPRVYLAMASDGLIFRRLGAIHPRFRTPHIAIAAQALWSSLLVVTGTYRALFTRVVFTEWIFFGSLALGVLRVRRRTTYRPAFRAWGSRVLPLVFAAACGAIVANELTAEPRESAYGLAIVAAGLPIYYLWRRVRARSRPNARKTRVGDPGEGVPAS